MPVFDFNSVPDEEKKNAVCTYEIFMSSEESATPEKPILVIDNKKYTVETSFIWYVY